MACYPLGRVEHVTFTIGKSSDLILKKDADPEADLEVETLNGQAVGIFAIIHAIGLGGSVPQPGTALKLAISFTGIPEPVEYSGEVTGCKAGLNKHSLPVIYVRCPKSITELYEGLPDTLRCVLDAVHDNVIVNEAKEPDFSGVAAGALSEQLLLRVKVIKASNLQGVQGNLQIVLKVGDDRRHAKACSIQAQQEEFEIGEDYTFLISSDQAFNGTLSVEAVMDDVHVLADGTLAISDLAPLVEQAKPVLLYPVGTVDLHVVLTALLQAKRSNEGVASTEPPASPEHVRFSGWLMKMQKKKFGMYHKRWFELQDTSLSYFKSKADIKPQHSIDISQASISITGPATETMMLINAPTKKLTLKSPSGSDKELREWAGRLTEAQHASELKREKLANKMKSILKKSTESARTHSKSVTINPVPVSSCGTPVVRQSSVHFG